MRPLDMSAPCCPLVGQAQCKFRHAWVWAAESGGVRPFGVSLLMAGYDDNGPQLYQIDPSGSYFAWKASAIGKNMTNAKTFLEKRYSEVVTAGFPLLTAVVTVTNTVPIGFGTAHAASSHLTIGSLPAWRLTALSEMCIGNAV